MTDSHPPRRPLVVIVMGVAGAGKTTVGRALAASLHWEFADADDYHPALNVGRIRSGIPLTDDDRAPWLAALRDRVSVALDAGAGLVLACSALRQRYRDALVPSDAPPGAVAFVHLAVPSAVLASRLERRAGHFAGESLLGSQLRTLEAPSGAEALRLDGDQPVDALVRQVRSAFGL
ncbi:MAG: gluconokinase [Gemmatimonadaceae bacterium]